MVQVIEGERASAEGHKLFAVTVLPDAGQAPGAVLCWHHGVGEHIGRYEKVFARLAQAGIAVYSGDIVGHGKSEGHRAYIESYTDTVEEFLALCEWAAADVKARYPGAAPPFFIGGHSLGGLVAALACHRDQTRWAGLMVCSPAMDVEMGLVLKIQAALGGLLAAIAPRARMVPAVDPKDMNPDPKCVEDYCNDPLNTVGNLPMRTGNEVLKAMRWLRARWPDFTLPIYMHHGEGDKCTSPKASQAFVAAASSTDKTANIVPGGYHEVLLTAGVADTLTDNMIKWIKDHATGPRAAAASGAGTAAGATEGGNATAAAGAAAKM
ncbi:hypothetical protein ABPG75_004354 [Micractinium tetrahymenae]